MKKKENGRGNEGGNSGRCLHPQLKEVNETGERVCSTCGRPVYSGQPKTNPAFNSVPAEN